jgi:excinuclease ABC subunit C
LEFEITVKSEKLKVGEGVVANLDSVLESEGVKELRSERVDPAWELPDLIIVDGGKGQLSADYEVLLQYRQKFAEQGLEFSVEMCSLAKREEEIFLPDMSNISAPLGKEGGILLSGQAKFLIQRIRDEAHRFAITNNRNARLRTISKSKLDEIPGVGPTTKEKLLKTFGSVERVMNALDTNQELVLELIGKSLTAKLRKWFGI